LQRTARSRRLGLTLAALLAMPAALVAAGRQERPLDAALVDLAGAKVKLSSHHGKAVLLELWASWCLPCHEQSAELQALAGELATAGVAVLAIDVGEDAETVTAHLERQPTPFPVLLDRNQQIPGKLGIDALPGLVLLRPDGTVAAQRSGLLTGAALRDWLGDALPAPPAAGN
jgi:thiol-disulfide isomerase/thioredoxin